MPLPEDKDTRGYIQADKEEGEMEQHEIHAAFQRLIDKNPELAKKMGIISPRTGKAVTRAMIQVDQEKGLKAFAEVYLEFLKQEPTEENIKRVVKNAKADRNFINFIKVMVNKYDDLLDELMSKSETEKWDLDKMEKSVEDDGDPWEFHDTLKKLGIVKDGVIKESIEYSRLAEIAGLDND